MNIGINKTVEIIKNISYKNLMKMLEKKEPTIHLPNNIKLTYINYGREGVVYKLGQYALKFYREKNHATNELEIIKKYIIPMNGGLSDNFLKVYNLTNIFGHAVIIMELIEGNLQNWVLSKHSDNEWLIMLFHVLCGILFMQCSMRIFHSDVRPKNILFSIIPEPITVKYVIKDKYTTINTTFSTNTFFKIADFGKATGLNLKHNRHPRQSIKLFIESNADLSHMRELYIRLAVDSLTYSHTLKDLIEIGKNDEYFKGYLKKKEQQINSYMPDDMKEPTLFRAVAYYLIEKKYFDLNNFPDTGKVHMPSQKIRDILDLFEITKDSKSLVKLIGNIGNMINNPSLTSTTPNKEFIFECNWNLFI